MGKVKRTRTPPRHPRGPVRHLTEAQKVDILDYSRRWMSPTMIAVKTGVPETTIQNVIKSFAKYQTLTPRRGRPPASVKDLPDVRGGSECSGLLEPTADPMRGDAGVQCYITGPAPILTTEQRVLIHHCGIDLEQGIDSEHS
jgi:hypothetical protein